VIWKNKELNENDSIIMQNRLFIRFQQNVCSGGTVPANYIRTICLAIMLIVCFLYVSDSTAQPSPPVSREISVTDTVPQANDLIVEFGSIAVDDVSTQSVMITNIGTETLHIFLIGVADPLSDPFIIQTHNCSDLDLGFRESCTLDVSFEPAATGSYNDSFDIPSNDDNESTVTITVNGTGSDPGADISVTDPDIAFGQVSPDSQSERTVTIENIGNSNLQIFDIALADTLDSPFSLVNDNCSNVMIAPSGTCEFMVRFEPLTLGDFNDSFDIPSNDLDESPVTVTVSGNASNNNSPTIPQLVYPAADQSCTRTSETFIWDKSMDPDGDEVTYTLEMCRDINFTAGCIMEANIIARTHNQMYHAGTGTWFLMVGMVLAGSFARKNRMALLLAIVIITTSFLLIACGGSGGGDDGGGSCDPPAIPNVDQATQVSRTVSGLSSNAEYFWKVKAEDGLGGVINSNVKSFTTL
jgi:hypothetical protein